jgi:tetratricopeptide (TPR) repeat protein
LGLLGAAAWRQAEWWRDSVTLWTRAVALDPTNDVALYNLALAREETGDEAGALESLRETLRLVPDHEPARRELASLELRGFERDAGRAAEGGRWDEAISLYSRALERDGERMRSRASRGMALLQKSRLAEAAEDLAAARRLGNDEANVASALSLCLAELGRDRDARDVLRAGLQQHPQDVGLAHNLARLLVTSDDPAVRDAAQALALAQAAEKATGGRDPRVYDTLAAAYAATGHSDQALEAARHGVALARSTGDEALARALEARLRSLKGKSPGP